MKSKARHASKEDGELELESPNSQGLDSTPSSTGKSALKFNMKKGFYIAKKNDSPTKDDEE